MESNYELLADQLDEKARIRQTEDNALKGKIEEL